MAATQDDGLARMAEQNNPSAPGFQPRLFEDGGVWFYEDGHVFGSVDIADMPGGGRSLLISEWSCDDRNQGHTTRALQWMRSQFQVIGATGVGSCDDDGVWDIATNYWAHMHRKGLVDELFDDDCRRLEVEPDGTVRFRTAEEQAKVVHAAEQPSAPASAPRKRRP